MLIKKLHCTPTRLSLVRDDRGLATVEYVILLVVVAVMSVIAWHNFGSLINKKLDDSSKTISTDVNPTPAPAGT